ncbi:hypothetical protein HOLleu_10407 [Holothuria leucospilota]|uniref:C2H2-type domain-containing protein n=1 Tax=Holothuria leucospilota TaxID=206669 RepID=A0A9Q1CE96_HOLLE|nr:hypothetical protein HOLleu_10407 [Holothuria leucospilota]
MNQLSREEEESLVKALERVERLQLAERQRQAFLERRTSMNVPPSSPTEPMETSGPMQSTATLPEPTQIVPSESLPDTQPVEEMFDLTADESSQAFTVSNEDKQERVKCAEGCGKTFPTRKEMKRHLRRVHIAPTYQCMLCEKKFKTSSNKKKHMESCVKKQKKTPSDSTAKTRKRKRSEPTSGESPVKKKSKTEAEDVAMRDLSSTNRDTPSTSGMQTHSDLWTRNAGVAAEHLSEDPISMPEAVGNQIPENFQPVYRDNWRAIRTHHHRGNRVQDMYNFRITDLSDASMRNLENFYMNKDTILHHVKSGEIFGVVECDITVPDPLKSHFSEMPPIFKNTEVGIQDIGDHMARYAEQHKVLKQPRRTLIGSVHGTKLLLATPLLRWYLNTVWSSRVFIKWYNLCLKPCSKPLGKR